MEHELFLKSLPDDATVASVRAFFSECTSLRSVKLNKDKATGKCKGSGWMILGSKGDADWIMEEWNGAEMAAGQPIQIERSGSSTWKDASAMERSVGLPCRFGLKCTRADCTFGHPDGWDSQKPAVAAPRVSRGVVERGACRFGVGCSRADCFFSHPEGWNPNKTTKKPCKSGRACTFPGCFYAHPHGRDCDLLESKKPDKKQQKQKKIEAAPDVSEAESKPRKKNKPKGSEADIEQSFESRAAAVINKGMDVANKKRKTKFKSEAKLALESLAQVDAISTKAPRKKKARLAT